MVAVARPPGAGGFACWMFIFRASGIAPCAPARKPLCMSVIKSASINMLLCSVGAMGIIPRYDRTKNGLEYRRLRYGLFVGIRRDGR